MTLEEIDRRLEELQSKTNKNLDELIKLAKMGDPSGVIGLELSISVSVSEIKDLAVAKFQAKRVDGGAVTAA